MVSFEVGHVYLIHTALTKPEPKDKLILCICDQANLFLWFNSKPAHHGIGQLPCAKGEHEALWKDCHLDMARVTTFAPHELAIAGPRGPVSETLMSRIRTVANGGVSLLAPRHLKLIRGKLCGMAE